MGRAKEKVDELIKESPGSAGVFYWKKIIALF
jgi:hypothetical protein